MSAAFPLTDAEIQSFIDIAFAEDIGTGDVTAEATIPADALLTATMNAREPMVVAGLPLVAPIFHRLDPAAHVEILVSDGQVVAAGTALVRISGRARALLSAERTALNILQHLSGIATLTWTYALELEGTKARLLDTRKTIPGLRKLAKYATLMGGGVNHRMGLFDAVLIKDNHIAVAGSVTKAVEGAIAHGQTRIQVECDTLDQAAEAIKAGATSLLLDNMSLDELRAAVTLNAGRVPLEASGGVKLDTIRGIAETGVDFISVGRLTQSAPAVDIGLDWG